MRERILQNQQRRRASGGDSAVRDLEYRAHTVAVPQKYERMA